MKTSNTLLVLGAALLLSSCSSWQHADFSKRKYMKHFRESKFEFEKEASAAVEQEEVTAAVAVQDDNESKTVQPVLSPPAMPVIAKAEVKAPVAAPQSVTAPVTPKETVKEFVKQNMPVLAKVKQQRHRNFFRDQTAEIILAIIIPPVGVLIHDGSVKTPFWISLLLTLLFWLPGAIYSLLYVTGSIS